MSTPDSWEQMMDPRIPPGQGSDLNTRFSGMSVNAHSFVPNVRAQSFVPGAGSGGGYVSLYGHGGYHMHGE